MSHAVRVESDSHIPTRGGAHLQLQRVDLLGVAGVSFTLVLDHLPVGLTGHQAMDVVIWNRSTRK